ncbi:MAG: CgeB family protein [Cellulosilyticaceae bacterium]
MRKNILQIQAFKVSEWLVSLGEPMMCYRDGQMVITHTGLETCTMAYRDLEHKLKKLITLTDRYNTYEIITHIVRSGGVEVEIGIAKYYTNGSSETTFYPPNQPIQLLSESLDSIYIVLRFKGSGKVRIEKLTIEAIDKVYLNYETDKAKKIDVFYDTWRQKKALEEPVKVPENALKIACILDEFSYECWRYEAQFMQLTSDKWQEEIEAFAPDMLLVESAWQGKNGSWTSRIARLGAYYDENMRQLIKYCNQKKIPTVFWDKEGINNFYYFISTASLFDYVGVTDENVLAIHQGMSKKERAFILPFAAQPLLHHNRGRMESPLGKVAFAGSWYGEKYRQRMRDMEYILKPAIQYNLEIFDRNYDKKEMVQNKQWQWPEIYQKCIVGKLPYSAMNEAYRQYEMFLNVQSIHESKWMIPRRIYELLACGTPIISSDSDGIRAQFGEEVFIANSEEETVTFIEKILSQSETVTQRVERGMHKVYSQHTYKHRLQEILNRL